MIFYCFFRLNGYIANMLVEYDILSSAGNRPFAKANGAVPEQLRIAHQKSSEEIQFSITNLEKDLRNGGRQSKMV
jgi:hypothetical protein